MYEKLNAAFDLADSIRYSGDVRLPFQNLSNFRAGEINSHLSQTGLRISEKLTPDIYDAFKIVFSHLQINPDSITAYVYSSPETQATCFSDSRHECIIGVTSSLINLMSKEELTFVIGHELGHFLLGHNLEEKQDTESEEYLIKSRAQEISVDRIGLISCGSLNISIQALMKLVSGLGEDMLRFDIGSFLDQMRTQKNNTVKHAGENSTHPSFLMRCRALLWFSMSDGYSRACGNSGGEDLNKIDQRITADSEKFVDGPARERISEARENLVMWFAALASVRNGTLNKSNQKIIEGLVGPEMLKKLLNLYSEQSRTEVIDITQKKLTEALSQYQKIAPSEATKNLPMIKRKICTDFKQPDFLSYISNLI